MGVVVVFKTLVLLCEADMHTRGHACQLVEKCSACICTSFVCEWAPVINSHSNQLSDTAAAASVHSSVPQLFQFYICLETLSFCFYFFLFFVSFRILISVIYLCVFTVGTHTASCSCFIVTGIFLQRFCKQMNLMIVTI